VTPRDMRPALHDGIRLLVLLLGLCMGFLTYSYGMFHRLAPTWSDIATVAHCGVPANASVQASDTARLESGGSFFCQISPGKWIKTPYGTAPLFLALGIALVSAVGALYRSSLLRWATRSARGLITLLLLLFGIPMTLLGLQLNLIEGTLTLGGALRIVFYAAFAGGAMGLFFWYILVRHSPSNRSAT